LRISSGTAVSVLFSEPKIPQLCGYYGAVERDSVSVLFSEPKIPQCRSWTVRTSIRYGLFQCSSASRKFLNRSRRARHLEVDHGFSALQRAENSSI